MEDRVPEESRSFRYLAVHRPHEDLDWPEKPIKPIYQDYPKKLQRRETRHNTPGTNNASSQPMVTGIHQPDEIDPNGRPNSVAEMTKGRDSYRQNWEEFLFSDREYREQMKAIRELTNWVLTSVSPTIQETALLPGKTLKEWYATLAEAGKVHEERLMTDTQSEYRQHLKTLQKNSKKLDEWLQRWQEIMTRGIRHGVPETQSMRTWSHDLLQAVAPIMPNWSSNFRMMNKEKLQAGTLTYQSVVADLLDEWTMIHGQRHAGRAMKAAFPAYHGQEVGPVESDTRDEIRVAAGQSPQTNRERPPRGRGGRGNRARGGKLGTKANARDRSRSRSLGKENAQLVYSSTLYQPATMPSPTSRHLGSSHIP